MSIEEFAYKESEFEKARKAKEAEGWHFMGQENFTKTSFSKEAKFEEVPHQTEEEIKARYLEEAKQKDPSSDFEVDLMLDENTDKLMRFRKMVTDEEYQRALENLAPGDKRYLVWVRKIEKQLI